MSSEIVIAHISDLHHPTIKEEAWTRLSAYLVDAKPDLILVTGDLTNHPWPWRHNQVKRKLEELVAKCEQAKAKSTNGASASHATEETAGVAKTNKTTQANKTARVLLRVVAGNHDSAFWGNIGFWLFRKLSFDLVFRKHKESFFEYTKGNCKAYFFCFNSNPMIAKFAKGAVGRWEFKRFQRKIDELQKPDPDGFDEVYKIALLHHHPVPLPYEENVERFLFLKNAGDFLNAMAQNRINLVLHGHKHEERLSHVKLGTTSSTRNFAILASGSTLKAGQNTSSCNLIRIHEDMRAEIAHVYSKDGGPFKPKERVLVPSWPDYIEERYRAVQNKLGYAIKEMTRITTVDEEGDGRTEVRIKGLRITNQQSYAKNHNKVEPFEQKVNAGSINKLEIDNQDPLDAPLEQDDGSDPRFAWVKINLGDDDEKSYSFSYHYYTLNSWALNTEEWDRKYVEGNGLERNYESVHVDAYKPIDVLNVEIHLPANSKVEGEPQLTIYAPEGESYSDRRELKLEEVLKTSLKYSAMKSVILLNVEKPLYKYRYKVRWRLSDPAVEDGYPTVRDETNNLINQISLLGQTEPFRRLLVIIEKDVCSQLEIKDETIDVTIAVPVHEKKQVASLKFVASNLISHPILGRKVPIGDGTQGRAYKEAKPRLYNEGEIKQGDPKWNIYIPVGDYKHSVLYSVPILHPLDPKQVIGVLSVGSQITLSGLKPVDKEDGKKKTDKIINVANTYILGKLAKEWGLPITYPKPKS